MWWRSLTVSDRRALCGTAAMVRPEMPPSIEVGEETSVFSSSLAMGLDDVFAIPVQLERLASVFLPVAEALSRWAGTLRYARLKHEPVNGTAERSAAGHEAGRENLPQARSALNDDATAAAARADA